MAAAKSKADAGLVTAIVAPRKTVLFDDKYVGPGGQVELSAEEVAELRAAGFLVDPDVDATPNTGDGPTFELGGEGEAE